MSLIELIKKRQSDRAYTDRPVEPEKLTACLEAARLAPSASNSQPWTFVVLTDPQTKEKVANKTFGPLKSFNKFVPQAPVIVCIVMERAKFITEAGGRLKKKEYPLIDIGIAAEHFCLQAAELGLGTCMLGWFDEKAIKELIHVPENKNIPLLISLGYVPEDYKLRVKVRKNFETAVKWNTYK
jgi:nitroreductase